MLDIYKKFASIYQDPEQFQKDPVFARFQELHSAEIDEAFYKLNDRQKALLMLFTDQMCEVVGQCPRVMANSIALKDEDRVGIRQYLCFLLHMRLVTNHYKTKNFWPPKTIFISTEYSDPIFNDCYDNMDIGEEEENLSERESFNKLVEEICSSLQDMGDLLREFVMGCSSLVYAVFKPIGWSFYLRLLFMRGRTFKEAAAGVIINIALVHAVMLGVSERGRKEVLLGIPPSFSKLN